MKTLTNGEGFLLLESAILGLLLVVMAGFLVLPRHTAAVLRMEECRTTAIFLAEQELAELESRARGGTLADGIYGWLGPAEDLDGRPAAYEVAGTAQKDGARGFALTVRVSWQDGGKVQDVRFERWVARHDVP